MDVINTRADLVGVSIMLEGIEEFHVTLGGLNRDDISIKTLDGGENVVEIRVAEVRVGLELVGDPSGGKFEGINGPLEVRVPVRTTKRQLGKTEVSGRKRNIFWITDSFADCGLINLNSADAGLFEIHNFITKGESKLFRLQLTRNIGTRERPIEDGDRPSKHTLHRLRGKALCITAPLDSHRPGAGNIRNNDRRADITRSRLKI